jgi:flagellar biosynthesis/type III secretory pathway M-ring protein FliF/YscJ
MTTTTDVLNLVLSGVLILLGLAVCAVLVDGIMDRRRRRQREEAERDEYGL